MTESRYTDQHEWVRVEGDVAVVGITDYAQQQLGDVVYVELPAVGKAVKQGGEMAVVESVKAASEVYAPASGTVTEINDMLGASPQTINEDAEGKGWFAKIRLSDKAEIGKLMDAAAYRKFVEDLG
ncbi:MAG: glycine cleavage system protein GcvH [Gemmatimonas sp.]